MGVADVQGGLAGVVLQPGITEAAWAGAAVVADLVSGATISGSAGGSEMVTSEMGEPESVTGGGSVALADVAVIAFDDAAGTVESVVTPCPGLEAFPGLTSEAVCAVPTQADSVLTSRAVLVDGVTIEFGSVLGGGEFR